MNIMILITDNKYKTNQFNIKVRNDVWEDFFK